MLSLCLSAVLSGLLLTAAFPPLALWPLAGVAFVPFLSVLRLRKHIAWRGVFAAACCLTATWHLTSLWWISHVTLAGMLALVVYVALLSAVPLTLSWWLNRHGTPLWIAMPGAWLAFELAVTYLLTGFPWLLLGSTWRPLIPIIQCADLGGVYVVSWVVMVVNAALAQALVPGAPGVRRRCSGIVAAAVLLAAMYLYGTWRIGQLDADTPRAVLRVACVQPNIPALVKHDPRRDMETFATFRRLTLATTSQPTDLVFWPETAPPGYYFEYGQTYRIVTNIVGALQRPILSGLARYERRSDRLWYYNSAAIIHPDGSIDGLYDKMHLVAFGEYVPLARYLPFLSLVTPIEASYSRGTEARLLKLRCRGELVRFGPLICFEDVFGHMARLMARSGADVLVNLTNDGWFRSSPGPYQHVALAALRCVETRRPLVRCTNSGVTALIDRAGRTTAVFAVAGRQTEVAGVLHGTVDVYNGPLTLCARWGDWFPAVWTGVVAGLVVWTVVRRRASGY